MTPDFWRGRRVFLTGHTGFKGSWLSLWLQDLGAHVTGFALAPPTSPSLFKVAAVGSGMTSIQGDVRDGDALNRAMLGARPEIVIHMAAQSLVRRSYADPVETYSTNVMGVVNLFQAVRATPSVSAVLNVTTDKCYENREWPWGYRENEALGGYDPYSSSKACAELVTAAYRSSWFNPAEHARHGTGVASARAGNVIGGGDWAADRLIPDILRAFGNDQPAPIRNPGAIRPWQHVLEPLRGYLLLAQKLVEEGEKYSQAWNFGPKEDDAKPVSWIADRLAALWGPGASWKSTEGEHPHEAGVLKLDVSKARYALGWSPLLNLEQALQYTIAWSQALSRHGDARKITIEQICSYQGLFA